jgi:hypothetical protein
MTRLLQKIQEKISECKNFKTEQTEVSDTAEISYTRLRNQQKSNPKSRNHERNQWILKSEITQNFVIIEPTVYMTAVTHKNQEIGL